MSVVLCVGLADGVLLASDCRATWCLPDGSKHYSDDVQKIFPVEPGTAIGFVGDIRVAAWLLRCLFWQLPARKHRDPESLSWWLPRLFRWAYGRYLQKIGPSQEGITFIVPYVLGDRATLIQRKEFGKLFSQSLDSNMGISPFVWGLFKALEGKESVLLRQFPYSTFYVMRSPNFDPAPEPTLSFKAFGSGKEIVNHSGPFGEFTKFANMIQQNPDKPGLELVYLEGALWSVAHAFDEATVGGMFPILKIMSDRTEFRGAARRFQPGAPEETVIELALENGRMIQRNRTNGREVGLKYPWELGPMPTGDRFDDFDNAWRETFAPKG